MTKRTANEFKEAAAKSNITRWQIHDCSMCGYPCGYEFHGDQVFYDSGCDCVRYSGMQTRSWDDVASHYNMQDHPEYIAKMDKFWGFAEQAPEPSNA